MNRAWLLLLPLLFLPRFGITPDTVYGSFDFSDFVMIPFVIVLLFPKKWGVRTLLSELQGPVYFFLLWALVGVLMIVFSFEYTSFEKPILFSLLKLGKMSLYVYAGFAVCRILGQNRKWIEAYHWALLACGVVIGLGVAGFGLRERIDVRALTNLYKGVNTMSITLAILIAYIGSLFVNGYGSTRWRGFAVISLLTMIAGISFSTGRGGWMAVVIGAIYLFYKRGLGMRTVFSLGALALGALVLYQTNLSFQRQVDMTFNRSPAYLEKYRAGVMGVDDGVRIRTWKNEAPKFFKNPVFGTGFFHRGGLSGLWATGSHNFWLQILLETGLIGGLAFFIIAFRAWRQTNMAHIQSSPFVLPIKVAFIVAFIGGLGGEYFYGGLGLLALLLVYAPLGAEPWPDSKNC